MDIDPREQATVTSNPLPAALQHTTNPTTNTCDPAAAATLSVGMRMSAMLSLEPSPMPADVDMDIDRPMRPRPHTRRTVSAVDPGGYRRDSVSRPPPRDSGPSTASASTSTSSSPSSSATASPSASSKRARGKTHDVPPHGCIECGYAPPTAGSNGVTNHDADMSVTAPCGGGLCSSALAVKDTHARGLHAKCYKQEHLADKFYSQLKGLQERSAHDKQYYHNMSATYGVKIKELEDQLATYEDQAAKVKALEEAKSQLEHQTAHMASLLEAAGIPFSPAPRRIAHPSSSTTYAAAANGLRVVLPPMLTPAASPPMPGMPGMPGASTSV